MSVHSGPADWWTDGTNAGRSYMATKGIVQDGLVFNIDAGVVSSYPGTGTSLVDLRGNENMTIYNGVAYSTDNGGAFVFDGVNDYIRTPNNVSTASAVSVVSPFTIEQVFKPTGYQLSAYAGLTNMLLTKNFSGNTFNYVTQLSNDTTFAFLKRTNPESIQGVTWTVPSMVNKINYATVTVVGLNVSLYFNGVFQSTKTVAGLPIAPSATNEQLQISTPIVSTQTCYIGYYYNARIYNRALSDNEIKNNFNATRTRFGL